MFSVPKANYLWCIGSLQKINSFKSILDIGAIHFMMSNESPLQKLTFLVWFFLTCAGGEGCRAPQGAA